MKALLKIFSWSVGLLIVVIIAAILILPRTFDPNDHKDRIEAFVLDKTDRVLTIDGDLSLSVFPSLSVKTGAVSLANPDGGAFGDNKMVEVESASIDVKLIPLLSKEVEAGEIVLMKPVVRLMTLADGTTNWQDFQGEPQAADSSSSSDNAGLAALAIQGVRIEQGHILWDDQQSEVRYDLSDITVTTGAILPGADIPVELSAHMEGDGLPEPLDIKLTSAANLDLPGQTLTVKTLDLSTVGPTLDVGVTAPDVAFDLSTSRLDATVLNIAAKVAGNDIRATLPSLVFDLESQSLTTNGIEAEVQAGDARASVGATDLNVDLAAGLASLGVIKGQANSGENSATFELPSFVAGFDQKQFQIDNVVIDAKLGELVAQVEFPAITFDADAMNVQATGATVMAEGVRALVDVSASDLAESPNFEGRLRLPNSDLRRLVEKAAAYRASDTEALSNVALDLEFSGTPVAIDVPVLSASVDDTAIEGSAQIDLATSAYALNLNAGVIDLDRYMPAASEGQVADSDSTTSASSAAAAPVALGQLKVDADIRVQQVLFDSAGVRIADLSMTTKKMADGSGLVPVSVTGTVSGETLPEPINLVASLNLDTASADIKVSDVAVEATGETLMVRLGLPVAQLNSAGPISLASLTGAFGYGEINAEVGVTNVGFDPATGDVNVAGLTVNGEISGIAAALRGDTLSGNVNTQNFSLVGLKADVDRNGPIGTLSAPAFDVDLKAQTAKSDQLVFEGDAGKATLKFAASSIIDSPLVDAEVNTDKFNVRRLLEQLDMAQNLADQEALTQVSLATRVKGGLDALALEPLSVTVDETAIDGYVRIQTKPTTNYVYDINIGRLNLDRYTPGPGDTAVASEPESTNVAAAVAGPAELLKNLTVDGTVRVESLTTGGMDVTNIVVTTRSEAGVVTMSPISANLYDGKAEGSVVIDTNGEAPTITADQSLLGLNLGPALTAAGVSDKLLGTGDLVAKITATGIDAAAISRSMSGTVNFDLRDGALKGFDLQKILVGARRAYEAYKERDSSVVGGLEEQTKFSAMSGTLVLGDGNASNDDLIIKAPLFRIAGSGVASLIEQTIDYGLSVNIVGSVEGQGGAELDELKNVPIPVRIKGTFAEPGFSVDLVGLVKDKAKEEAKDKLREKLSEELGLPSTTDSGEGKKSTKDTLKGLLERKLEQEAGIDETPPAESDAAAAPDEAPKRKRSKDILRDVLKGSIEKEPADDEAVPSVAKEAESQPTGGRLDDVLDDAPADSGTSRLDDVLDNEQPTDEEPPKSAKDELKDELKNKLLKSLFD